MEKQKQTVFFQRFLDRLGNLVNLRGTTPAERALGFYHAVLELESIKEPDISNYYNYPLIVKEDNANVLLVDLTSNPQFLKAFEENHRVTFHKHLFIGIPVIFQNERKPRPLFSAVIEYDDLKGFDPQLMLLPYKISQMTFDSRFVEGLELSMVQVAQIESELSTVTSLDSLKLLVKKYLGNDSEIKNELWLALSSKNIALSQILAEYRKLDPCTVTRNDLLNAFLSNTSFDNEIEKISTDEICHVTKLDASQEKVVAQALGNRLTVVTGAPGTGKTQVILNLIANALLRNKTVLMASKNNKAVDNVKDRFDNIDPTQYLIRYGKKENLTTQTIPTLKKLTSGLHADLNKPARTRDAEELANQTTLNRFNITLDSIKECHKKLARIEQIKQLLSNCTHQKEKLNREKEALPGKNQQAKDKLKLLNSDVAFEGGIANIDSLVRDMKIFRNTLESKYSGFTKLWHNLFSKKEDTARFLNMIERYPDQLRVKVLSFFAENTVSSYRKGQDIIDNVCKVIPYLDKVSGFQKRLTQLDSDLEKALKDINYNLTTLERSKEQLQGELQNLPSKDSLWLQLQEFKNIMIEEGKAFVNAKIFSLLHHRDATDVISRYTSYLVAGIPWRDEDIRHFKRTVKEFLSVCKLSAVTNLSIKSSFPLSDQLFDLLIIDEASQCDVASAIPLILRAKQAVVIGDPMQLRHITSVKTEEESAIKERLGCLGLNHLSYVDKSLWDYSFEILTSAKNNKLMLMLENHYRCHPDIIGYSNEQFYKRRMGVELNIKTDLKEMKMPQKGMVLNNVRGFQRDDHVNVNELEARRCIEIARELCSLKSDISIGVVTPFRDQADYILSNLPQGLNKNVEVNTAHGFQGDEKDVIIYSLVVTDNSPDSKLNWIDYRTPNLVNVAVTRAKQTLYIVCNVDYIRRNSSPIQPLGYLVKYAEDKLGYGR